MTIKHATTAVHTRNVIIKDLVKTGPQKRKRGIDIIQPSLGITKMRLVPYKCFKQLTIAPRWSTVLPLLLYLVFISFILHMTFPLRSTKGVSSNEDSNQIAKELKDLGDSHADDVEADESENKLVEKAKSLGVVENANEVLRDVFNK